MKKAQTELMGLMVIFILFIFIGLIYLKFSGGAAEEPMADTRTAIEGSNMVSALMSYTICDDNDFRDALKACLEGDQDVCGAPSCNVVKTTAEGVVKAVMGNDTYQFVINGDGEELVKVPEADITCKNMVVNTFNNTLVKNTYIRLKTCKKGSEITVSS
ncbi:MAG: hypothetical protein V1914_01815 [archaeon]